MLHTVSLRALAVMNIEPCEPLIANSHSGVGHQVWLVRYEFNNRLNLFKRTHGRNINDMCVRRHGRQ